MTRGGRSTNQQSVTSAMRSAVLRQATKTALALTSVRALRCAAVLTSIHSGQPGKTSSIVDDFKPPLGGGTFKTILNRGAESLHLSDAPA